MTPRKSQRKLSADIPGVNRHPNATWTIEGKRRACEAIDAGTPIAHIAREMRVSRQTMTRWYGRWAFGGEAGLEEGSSRPRTSPAKTPDDIEHMVLDVVGGLVRRVAGPGGALLEAGDSAEVPPPVPAGEGLSTDPHFSCDVGDGDACVDALAGASLAFDGPGCVRVSVHPHLIGGKLPLALAGCHTPGLQ